MSDSIRAALEWLIARLDETADPDGPVPAWVDSYCAARAALAEQQGEAIGPEWQPCVKLPITVYVREQRPGETHVSTREGITPVQPDDLIMRGVAGEEYPIGRELFNKTYRLGVAEPTPPAEGEVAELAARLRTYANVEQAEGRPAIGRSLSRAAELLQQQQPTPVPVSDSPKRKDCDHISIDQMCEILRSQGIEAAEYTDCAVLYEVTFDQLRAICNTRAVLARWGHQPTPPAEGEVGELMAWLRENAEDERQMCESSNRASLNLERAAELLQQFASPPCLVLKPSPESLAALKAAGPGRIELLPDDAQIIEPSHHNLLVPVPTPVPVSERLPGPDDRNAEGGCWWFCTAYPGDWPHWILGKEAFCDPTHWLPAHALPLPQGEVKW